MNDTVTGRATASLEEQAGVIRDQIRFLEMSSPLVEALSDLRLMVLASLGRIETIAAAGVAPEELDSIVRHVTRLEHEIQGLRADYRALRELVQDVLRVRGTRGSAPDARPAGGEYRYAARMSPQWMPPKATKEAP